MAMKLKTDKEVKNTLAVKFLRERIKLKAYQAYYGSKISHNSTSKLLKKSSIQFTLN